MNYIQVGKENSCEINLYYEDCGKGDPVVLIHGWPLSGASWEKQIPGLLEAGFRIITYDRRGFGRSSRPASGYDYDTFAHDLHKLITRLNLHSAALVGFSMGTGEVARYIGLYGTRRVRRAVFISGLGPFLRKTPDNPDGVDESVFTGIEEAVRTDRPAFLARFLSDFYNADRLKGKLISEQVIQGNWNVAFDASPQGTLDCVSAWRSDFREDLKRIDIPALVLHGDADRIIPISAGGGRMPEFVKTCTLTAIQGGPHGIIWTHADQVNLELLDFLTAGRQRKKSPDKSLLLHAR